MFIHDVHLNPHLLQAIKDLGFTEPTPIQEKCIPEILKGKDVFGHSSTCSGKTIAFALPIFEKIHAGKGIQALILTPTRELCVQVTDMVNDLGKYLHMKAISIYGGVGIENQIRAIRHCEIVT